MYFLPTCKMYGNIFEIYWKPSKPAKSAQSISLPSSEIAASSNVSKRGASPREMLRVHARTIPWSSHLSPCFILFLAAALEVSMPR